LEDFHRFLLVDLNLSRSTANRYRNNVERFFRYVKKKVDEVTREDIREFFLHVKSRAESHKDYLSALKRFFRDYLGLSLMDSFRYPKKNWKVRWVPSKEELKRFYQALPNIRGRAIFLFYATTGLRKMEVLSLRLSDIDFSRRMVIPRKKSSRTKHTFVTFYNEECEKVLMEYLSSRKENSNRLFAISHEKFCEIWRVGYQKTSIKITPRVLRRWFATEMARKGVSIVYIDAFQGRVPQTILAKHYIDFSIENLKKVYEKADLRILT